MTAIVSRERARGTYLTSAAGLLLLAVAVVMMFAAAPRLDHHLAAGHTAAKSTSAQLTAHLSHQVAFSSDSASARACRAGPWALRACAEAYTPSITSDN
jgi:hypothetical protein